jgi:outer membrane receptor for ferrienterochelin and colicins
MRLLFLYLVATTRICAQTGVVSGIVTHKGEPLPFINVVVVNSTWGTTTDEQGRFIMQNIPVGKQTLRISGVGYQTHTLIVTISYTHATKVEISLIEDVSQLQEVVVTGTMKEVTKMDSPIPIEVYAPSFFTKNPTANIFEALSLVNGVQPQINCNVCNTGDIHINGLEGPYTMILIDGMPIVSSLSTVYGLAGIPNSLVKRMEIVKGPASTLYGSEAVGGVINIITKEPFSVPVFKLDAFGTSIGEYNFDVASGFKVKKAHSLVGINYFHYDQPRDINDDNFTDVTLQKRISLFNKWSFHRNSGKNFSLAARYIHENRWGGEMQWTSDYRGSDQIYGESIYTNRVELIGNYQFNTTSPLHFDYSYNYHKQDSYYGTVKYMADQHVTFAQLRWNKKINKHDLLAGLPIRYMYYDDNTVGTGNGNQNAPDITLLPGIFIQDDITLSNKFTTLAGVRYDQHNVHGSIWTPRLSFKFSPDKNNTIRLTGGSGYRVVNLFTEDHAALTGSRDVIILSDLKPEQSWNVNLNYAHNFLMKDGFINLDGSLFYTYFSNKIVGDFLTDPDKIIYNNLDGYAISRGITVNADASVGSGLKIISGITWMDVFQVAENEVEGNSSKIPQLQAPRFSGTFTISQSLAKAKTTIDLTGRVTGPMHLPVVENDFRPAMSPWFALINLQATHTLSDNLEIYLGVKNLLNFIPENPLLRPFDPFDRNINVDNPNGYTFDTSYNYAPIQGARMQLGVRWSIN